MSTSLDVETILSLGDVRVWYTPGRHRKVWEQTHKPYLRLVLAAVEELKIKYETTKGGCPGHTMVQILAVCGSLRSASINSALLAAIAATAPADMTIVRAGVVGQLPLFNPDLEGREPTSVAEWRALVAASDGVVISSPEYAHGIPGALKNALDWLVGSGEFVGKPVAVLNAAPRSKFADEALREVLRTMDADIVTPASLDIAVLGSGLDADGLLADSGMAPLIRAVLPALADVL